MVLTREAEIWAATRTLAMHQEGGRCAHCHRDGCRLKVWAQTIRAAYARAGYPLPDDPAAGQSLPHQAHQAGFSR